MNRAKTIAIAVAVIIAIILIAQNTDEVRTRVLFVSITMPHAVLLLFTLLLGFAIGILASSRIRRSR